MGHLPTRGSAQELTTARGAIDDEIYALNEVVRRMLTRRNDFSPISRLPPELLTYVFTLHAIHQPPLGQDPAFRSDGDDDDDNDAHGDHRPRRRRRRRHRRHRDPAFNHDRNDDRNRTRDRDRPRPSNLTPAQLALGWITVTHVCRHWRQVALSNPNLWANIVFDLGAEWAEQMLERSKAAPISYCRSLLPKVHKGKGKALDDPATLRKHLSHIQRLKVSGDRDILSLAFSAPTAPAPHLESLELISTTVEPLFILPADLFSLQASRLRHLNLFSCSIPWDSFLLRDLTHLEIHVPTTYAILRPFEQSRIPSMDRLLSILEAMPSLQVLTLANCLPYPHYTNRVVPLQYLTKLSLEGLLSQVISTLKQVSLPGSASLSLRCPDPDLTDGSVDALIHLLTTHFRAPGISIPPLSTLSIDNAERTRSLTIVAWDKNVPLRLPRPRFMPTTSARLHLTLGCRQKALAEYLPLRLCKALPLKHLRAFSAFPSAFWTSADWVELSGLCPEVTHLRVDNNGAASLVPAMRQNAAFPAVVTLGFKRVDFMLLPWTGDHVDLCESVPALLRMRRDAGKPVERLEMAACAVQYTMMDTFIELVDDVAWNHDEEERSDSHSVDSFISDFSTGWEST